MYRIYLNTTEKEILKSIKEKKKAMETIIVIELTNQITQLALQLKGAYGKRLQDQNSDNKYVIAARAKMEAYNEILEIIKEISGV